MLFAQEYTNNAKQGKNHNNSALQIINCHESVLAYRTPAPGFYNDDDTPDFLIHYQYGPGYPVYYHAIVSCQLFSSLDDDHYAVTCGDLVSCVSIFRNN